MPQYLKTAAGEQSRAKVDNAERTRERKALS
jgi:hypothetical protein